MMRIGAIVRTHNVLDTASRSTVDSSQAQLRRCHSSSEGLPEFRSGAPRCKSSPKQYVRGSSVCETDSSGPCKPKLMEAPYRTALNSESLAGSFAKSCFGVRVFPLSQWSPRSQRCQIGIATRSFFCWKRSHACPFVCRPETHR